MFNNLTMKSVVLVLFVFFGSELLFAQSKKELIVSLTNRVDSLKEVVSKERTQNSRLVTKIQQLETAIKQLENEKKCAQ